MDIVSHVLLVRQKIDVQVDAQLAGLSVIIGIALPAIGRMALLVLVRIVILLQKVLSQISVLNVCVHPQISATLESVVACDAGTQRMVLGNLPVEPQMIVETVVMPVVSRMRVLQDTFYVSPTGVYEYEAAHGTVQRHYYKYLKGEPTSTNPVATIFAWTGALRKRGELDGIKGLVEWADKMEKATLSVIESGRMTGDLALITSIKDPVKMGSEEFLDAIAEEYAIL